MLACYICFFSLTVILKQESKHQYLRLCNIYLYFDKVEVDSVIYIHCDSIHTASHTALRLGSVRMLSCKNFRKSPLRILQTILQKNQNHFQTVAGKK